MAISVSIPVARRRSTNRCVVPLSVTVVLPSLRRLWSAWMAVESTNVRPEASITKWSTPSLTRVCRTVVNVPTVEGSISPTTVTSAVDPLTAAVIESGVSRVQATDADVPAARRADSSPRSACDAGGASQVSDDALPDLGRLLLGTEGRGRVIGDEELATVDFEHLVRASGHRHWLADERACGDGPEGDDHACLHRAQLGVEPRVARLRLERRRLLVQPPLAASLVLEVLHRVRDVEAIAVEAG